MRSGEASDVRQVEKFWLADKLQELDGHEGARRELKKKAKGLT